MHNTFVIWQGLSQLPGIQRCIQGFPNAHYRNRSLSPGAHSNLVWWERTLAQPGAFRTLVDRGRAVNRGISVDASKEFGIGLRVHDAYLAWRWLPGALGQGGRDIGGAEAIGLEFALRYLRCIGVHGERTRVLGDNTSTIGAFNRGRGRNVWTNESVRRAWEVQEDIDGELEVVYVRSAENPADTVSRGDFRGLSSLECAFDIPLELTTFLELV